VTAENIEVASQRTTRATEKRKETNNLRSAHQFLQKQITDVPEKEKNSYTLLLEVDLIKEIHKILMEGLLDGKTSPGIFSTRKRKSYTSSDKQFHYPIFITKDIAFAAITALVDIYNSSATHLKNKLSENTTEETLRLRRSYSLFSNSTRLLMEMVGLVDYYAAIF